MGETPKLKPFKAPQEHCSRWGGIPQDKITDFGRLCVEIMVKSFSKGPWNLPVNWQRVNWHFGSGVSMCVRATPATYDFNQLTNIVLAAHEHCVRIELRPASPTTIRFCFWQRQQREGSMFERHPTIEQAISAWNQRSQPNE